MIGPQIVGLLGLGVGKNAALGNVVISLFFMLGRHLQICPDAQLGLAEQLLLGVVDTAMMAQNALIAAESLGLGGV